jgi:hypothetical protein
MQASVERVFSSMNYVKNKLKIKMGDEYLNNSLVRFLEREFFNQVRDEDVINLFQKNTITKLYYNCQSEDIINSSHKRYWLNAILLS